MVAFEARLRAEIERVHGKDWCSRWDNGLPNFDEMPDELNVQEIVRLWHFARGLDLVEWGKMRYNLMGNAGHWFPGTNAAKFDPEQVRLACGASPFAERIPGILTEAHTLLHGEQQKRLSESD